MPVLLALGAVVAYANCLSSPFVFDDLSAIVDNPAIRQLWGGAAAGTAAGGLTLSGRPVLAFSFALNHAISGYAVWSYHALNLLIHVAGGLTLFGVLRRTLRRIAFFAPGPDLPALAVAFLWTVHPLQTESVTYVVQRAESLMGLFYLLTLYAFVRGVDVRARREENTPGPESPQGRWWLGAAIAACALGMATKEVMVTAPVLVLLYDRTFVAGTFAGAWRARRNFYLGLAATWLLLAFFVMSTGGNRGGTVGFGVGVTPWAYGLTQFHAIARYLALIFWPRPLVFDYGTFWVTQVGDILPYAAVVAATIGATCRALWRRPALGFAGGWFFGILAPTSLTPGTIQMIVEHRMYLSLAAPLALAVLALYRWAPRAASGIVALAGIACLVATVQRNTVYRTGLALWSATVDERPGNAMAQNNLGLALFRLGRIDEAMAHYESALRVDPNNLEARYNLALACARLGQLPAALENYAKILALRPDSADVRSSYGAALLRAGRRDDAAVQFQKALQLKPGLAEAHANLGDLLFDGGNVAGAAVEFETALRLKPDFAPAHCSLGNVLARQDRMADALAQYEEAVRLQPDFVDAQINAGNALLQLDRLPEAVAHYETALRLDPSAADAHNNLGYVWLHTGRVREAVAQFEQALAARPDFAEARRNLAEARAQLPSPP